VKGTLLVALASVAGFVMGFIFGLSITQGNDAFSLFIGLISANIFGAVSYCSYRCLTDESMKKANNSDVESVPTNSNNASLNDQNEQYKNKKNKEGLDFLKGNNLHKQKVEWIAKPEDPHNEDSLDTLKFS